MATVPEVSIQITHHAWITWSQIAIDHERYASEGRAKMAATGDVARDMAEEFRPGLVAVTAAAFALDALHKAMVSRGIASQPPPGDKGRGARAAATLTSAVDAKVASSWPERIKTLFKRRNDAVHFGESGKAPVPHPTGTNTAPEMVEWSAEEATSAVDLLLEVVDTLLSHPKPEIRTWAANFAHTGIELSERRRVQP